LAAAGVAGSGHWLKPIPLSRTEACAANQSLNSTGAAFPFRATGLDPVIGKKGKKGTFMFIIHRFFSVKVAL
jgi:hypothetical protein